MLSMGTAVLNVTQHLLGPTPRISVKMTLLPPSPPAEQELARQMRQAQSEIQRLRLVVDRRDSEVTKLESQVFDLARDNEAKDSYIKFLHKLQAATSIVSSICTLAVVLAILLLKRM